MIAALLSIALLAQALPPAPAAALDPGAPSLTPQQAALDARMRTYFAGEKNEGWAWLGVSLAATGASAGLMAASGDAAHGASYPLVDVGLVQLAASIYLLVHTGTQIDDRAAQIRRDPCAFLDTETKRMHGVLTRLHIATLVEALALAGGAGMAGAGATEHRDFLQGAGWGLVAQSVTMLVFDGFAATRAEEYERDLKSASCH